MERMYTRKQWGTAVEILEGCFNDYMTYANNRDTIIEPDVRENDLEHHVITKWDIIQNAMMKSSFFQGYVGTQDLYDYHRAFGIAFANWLNNKYLAHFSSDGYIDLKNMTRKERYAFNERGKILLELVGAIANIIDENGEVVDE